MIKQKTPPPCEDCIDRFDIKKCLKCEHRKEKYENNKELYNKK
jgi:hypothetical protein